MNANTPSAAAASAGKLSPIKIFLGILVLLIVIAGSIAIGLFANPAGPAATSTAPGPALHVVMFILGLVALVIGIAAWGIVLLTHNFTFDFTRPFFAGFGGKLWVANLLVGLLIQGGLAIMTAPLLMRLFAGRVPENILIPASCLIPFVAAQFLFIWFSMWAPLEAMAIRRRMRAMGFGEDLLASGIPVGISDPANSSFKKMTLVEEDLGLLWLAPDRIVYRGDTQWFDITREQLIEVQRKADAGSTSSYFGAAHVILHARQPDGSDRRIRLHIEGAWTQTAKARRQDRLADQIQSWRTTSM